MAQVRVFASAWSNVSYRFSRIVEVDDEDLEDLDPEDWGMILDEIAHETVMKDIEYGWTVIEGPSA